MPAAKGRVDVVALASTVRSEGEARFMLNAVSMARRVGTQQDPVVALDLDGRILAARTRSGRVEVPAPVDCVAWTETVRAFAERNVKGGSRKVLVTGIASERARKGFQTAGWTVQDHVARSPDR